MNNKVNPKKIFFWNMAGSTCNALASLIFLVAVSWCFDDNIAGIFSIGFAIAQLMWTIGYFDYNNTYQVTDVKNLFSFGDFLAFRILSCLIMIIISLINITLKNYDLYKAGIALLLCLFKSIDAFSGVFYGLFQKHERLDISGFSLAIRIILSVISLVLVMFVTKSLACAIITMCIVSVLWVVFYEFSKAKKYTVIKPMFKIINIKKLFIDCLPLFISAFVITYIGNIPKYAIDNYMNTQSQAYFNYIFMPAFVINLFSVFLLRPMLTSLAKLWNERDIKKFLSTIYLLLGWILFLTIAAVIFAYLLGIPVLNLIYHTDLSAYRFSLMLIMIGGGLSAATNVFFNIITILRHQRTLLIGYIASALISAVITPGFVKSNGITGACISYIISMAIIVFIFTSLFLYFLKKDKKTN